MTPSESGAKNDGPGAKGARKTGRAEAVSGATSVSARSSMRRTNLPEFFIDDLPTTRRLPGPPRRAHVDLHLSDFVRSESSREENNGEARIRADRIPRPPEP